VHTVQLRDVVRATPRTRLIRLDLRGAPFRFEAGQALMASLPGSQTSAAYSIASAPSLAERGTLELLVPADGAFGEPGCDPDSHVGQALTIEGPLGGFGVPGEAARAPLLLVGGGTGIAPLRSVALDRLERPNMRPMALVYSARTPDEFAFDEEFARLGRQGRLRVDKTVTRDEPTGGWPGRSGRIDETLLAAALPGADAWCLVCGPAGFVDTVIVSLERLGVPSARIVVER
jgi:NAD(P)H-flavin reductase